VKGNRVMGVIESVSDLGEVDIDAVREQYLVGNSSGGHQHWKERKKHGDYEPED
jgi:hypothetical protein